ncbi:hypothetical protein V1512DRAFT_260342 [Lipomyces arxii]|uniref:uncharacterized protein n=1 Tax=Lipomyces arxii TaxID=56418 RepID=UPI0034CED7A6
MADKLDMEVMLIPVLLKEAALDSPSFRTEVYHIHEQVEAVERWIDLYVKAGHRLSSDADSMQESINMLLSRSFPSFTTENVIDHDYTLTAMMSYSEGLRIFWANFIKGVKGMEKNVIEQLETLHKTDVKQYKDVKRSFDSAQSRYDTLVSRYSSQSKTKEASALREDAFQVYEARRQYVKITFDLCLVTASLKHALDRSIITGFSDQWLMIGQGINEITNPSYSRVADDLRRIRKWSDQMEDSMKIIFKELNITRRDLERLVLDEISPPRELSEYSSWTVPSVPSKDKAVVPSGTPALYHASTIDPETVNSEKHGWLFLRTYVGKPARQAWVRRWVFVKDGIFGWLVQSPNKSYVEESDKVGVLLCNVRASTSEDRRFCFEIITKDTTLVFQAESQQDLIAWLGVFDAAKRTALESSEEADTDMAFAIIPSLPEFVSTVQTSADTELSHERHDSSSGYPRSSLDLNWATTKRAQGPTPTIQALISAGQSITGQHVSGQNFITGADKLFEEIIPPLTSLAPTVLANNPLTTSMTKTAIAAHASISPVNFPNGLTANSWGSVNWASRRDIDNLKFQSGENEDGDGEGSSVLSIPKVIVHKDYGNMSPVIMHENFNNRTYPAFYPYELKVQDAQLRTLFPSIGPEENVVLVFRAVWNSKTSQEFSGRIHVTQSRIYLYANNGDMIFLRDRPLTDIISVRGEPNQNFDKFYIEFVDGTEMYAKTYLDSGRLIQYRMQFLIDNCKSQTPLDLEELLQKLREAKVNANNNGSDGWDDGPSPLAEDENDDIVPSTGGIASVSFDRRLLSNNQKLPDRSIKSKIKLPEAPIQFDLSSSMKLLYSQEFELSARGLFHLLFGDKSPIFQNLYYGSQATNVQQSPWIHLDGVHMEREFTFESISTVLAAVPRKQMIRCAQKVEQVEDYLLYVVYESRTPWNLPFANSFNQVSRYVVTYVSKSACKLSVWSTTEWSIPGPILESLMQKPALDDVAKDARLLGFLAGSTIRKLGTRGRTSKTIQLYGQVGKSISPVDVSGQDVQLLQDKDPHIMFISRRSFLFLILQDLVIGAETSLYHILKFIFGVLKATVKFVDGYAMITTVTVLSVLLNFYLSARSTTAFWSERRAYNALDALGVKPNGLLAKAVYLKDLDDYVSQGTEVAVNPNGLCYSRFRNVSEFLRPETPKEFVNLAFATDFTQDAARRIWMARQKAGIERHSHLVALRVLGKMEEELIMSQWETWLASEHVRCVEALSFGFADAGEKMKGGALPESQAVFGSNARIIDIDSVREYCQSCDAEMEGERKGLQWSKK